MLRGINLVVGPNGSGKSSLLRAAYSCEHCRKTEDVPTIYHYYNGELMNPRHKDMTGNSILWARALFSSHGETMRDVLAFIPLRDGDTLLLDEPEAGHDLEWMLKIERGRGFRRVARLGCQLVVATHHPVFMGRFPTIELERGYREKFYKNFQAVLTRNSEHTAGQKGAV